MEKEHITDLCLTTITSLSFFISFIYIKLEADWSRNKCFKALVVFWVVLELLVLLLLSLLLGGAIALPSITSEALHEVSITLSLWGIAIIQILGVIYPLNLQQSERKNWAIYAAVLTCAEVTATMAFMAVPEVISISPTLTAIAWVVAPLTTQVVLVARMFPRWGFVQSLIFIPHAVSGFRYSAKKGTSTSPA
ncbi:hypothetical protein FLAG1_07715 [Fusarium langsethiae]|uniref:Uncharacterized protein n=1 Tax=Fusarium langsethiae TaxID=179993 RepID=A0A0N0DDA8_FUSLA|nr:hypothetical protein FLAG1_07715 [Fusarium langsethiae]